MIDSYKHLNDKNDGVVIGIEEAVAAIEKLNYGGHRLLSAFVRCRLACHPDDALGMAVFDLLEKGMF